VEILDDAPAPYAQGIYAQPGLHDALIRFSSASNHLGPDALLGPVLGFAIKIFEVDGTKLVEDEPNATTFDYVLKNNPTFIANTAKHYLFIQEIGDQVGAYLERGKAGFHDLLNDFLTGKGTLEQQDWAWEELFAFVKAATQTPVRNPVLSTYWTMAAVRHGDYVAKVRVAPAADSAEKAVHQHLDLSSVPDVFGPTLVEELQAHAFYFDLQVQLCTDLTAMPVNDATVEWPEKLSPFVTVGRVRLPRQDISRPENPEKGDALASIMARHIRSPAIGRDHGCTTRLTPRPRLSPTTARAAATRSQQTSHARENAEYLISSDPRGERWLGRRQGRAHLQHEYGFPVAAGPTTNGPAAWRSRPRAGAIRKERRQVELRQRPPAAGLPQARHHGAQQRRRRAPGLLHARAGRRPRTAIGQTLKEFQNIFEIIRPPDVVDRSESDDYFAEMMVAGPDPTRLTRLDAVPDKFPITTEHLQSVPELTYEKLESALAAGRVYWVDHEPMTALDNGRHPQAPKYMYSPMAAFAVPRNGGAIRPFAIQWVLPVRREMLHARRRLLLEAGQELRAGRAQHLPREVTHLGLTHLISEAVLLAAVRNLASVHPVAVLLRATSRAPCRSTSSRWTC
jgi:hypothetical protein